MRTRALLRCIDPEHRRSTYGFLAFRPVPPNLRRGLSSRPGDEREIVAAMGKPPAHATKGTTTHADTVRVSAPVPPVGGVVDRIGAEKMKDSRRWQHEETPTYSSRTPSLHRDSYCLHNFALWRRFSFPVTVTFGSSPIHHAQLNCQCKYGNTDPTNPSIYKENKT